MAELSEEQLLLLNNLMYYQGSSNVKLGSVEDIANNLLVDAKNNKLKTLSGGFEKKPEQAMEIAEAILQDPELKNLKIVDSIANPPEIRATCFVDERTKEATVAVRGTGGSYEAWKNNVVAAYDYDTYINDYMEEFIEQLPYDNITITGHSKGGNLAQYATIMCGDKIDRCVSYDGQAFSKYFLEEKPDEIAANSSKIKSICASMDYINILMNSVAGETVYLESLWKENPHSSFALWKQNKGKMDEGGIYNETVEQSMAMKALDRAADALVNDVINELPEDVERAFVNWLGSCFGIAFYGAAKKDIDPEEYEKMVKVYEEIRDKEWEILVDEAGEEMSKFLKELKEKIMDILDDFNPGIFDKESEDDEIPGIGAAAGAVATQVSLAGIGGVMGMMSGIQSGGRACDFGIEFSGVNAQVQKLSSCALELNSAVKELDSIQLSDIQYAMVRQAIVIIKQKVKNQKDDVDKLNEVLGECLTLYKKTEKEIVA